MSVLTMPNARTQVVALRAQQKPGFDSTANAVNILQDGLDLLTARVQTVLTSLATPAAVPKGSIIYYAAPFASPYVPNFDNGMFHQLTLTGNVSISLPTGKGAGPELNFILIQDATGGRTVSFDPGYVGIDLADVLTVPNSYTHFWFVQRGDGKMVQLANKFYGGIWP